MSQTLLGADLRIGQRVAVVRNFEQGRATRIIGEITGVRLWNPEVIAVEIRGFGEWIKLEGSILVEVIE